jgi:hypothetical protein
MNARCSKSCPWEFFVGRSTVTRSRPKFNVAALLQVFQRHNCPDCTHPCTCTHCSKFAPCSARSGKKEQSWRKFKIFWPLSGRFPEFSGKEARNSPLTQKRKKKERNEAAPKMPGVHVLVWKRDEIVQKNGIRACNSFPPYARGCMQKLVHSKHALEIRGVPLSVSLSLCASVCVCVCVCVICVLSQVNFHERKILSCNVNVHPRIFM